MHDDRPKWDVGPFARLAIQEVDAQSEQRQRICARLGWMGAPTMSEHMDDHPWEGPESVPDWVDRVADRFEVAWGSSSRPSIEQFLAEEPESRRPVLLRELIQLEIQLRRRCGEEPGPAEYLQRFPSLDSAWLVRVFALLRGSEPQPAENQPAGLDAGVHLHAKRVRCPHCHNPIQLVDDKSEEVLCTGCGSTFRMRDSTITTTSQEMRPLGKFQLVERVGLGAFGAVWRAVDMDLKRTVALKIPHGSLLQSPTDLERFHREARTAAQLRHPGIVTVHEVTEVAGMPTIVSDFVDGISLRDLLKMRRLTFREAAWLVVDLAEALEYAHSMKAIHRDIKPANIMIEFGPSQDRHAEFNRQAPSESGSSPSSTELQHSTGNIRPKWPRPLLLDFGLALREDAEITMTMDGQIIGTPAYMSPEQAAGHGHKVDRRTDVYSLGVVLYELLTGELPFRGSKVMLVHQVLHEEPRPPRRINDKVPRDVETICLKAMAKSPGRRYATAQALSDDLRRWLRGESIHARPVGHAERLWRWCRRNPRVASLAAAVATLLLLLAIGSTFAAIQIGMARDRAVNSERKAVGSELKAEARYYDARQAVDDLLTSVAESKELIEAPGLQGFRRHLLERAKSYYEGFVQQRGEDRDLQHGTAAAYFRLATITDDLTPGTDAFDLYQQAETIWQKLLRENPGDAQFTFDLAKTFNNSALVLSRLGKHTQAISLHHKAREIEEKLVQEYPDVVKYAASLAGTYNNIGRLQVEMGQYADSRSWYQKAQDLRESLVRENPSVADYALELGRTYNNLANLEARLGNLAEAQRFYEKSIELRERLVHQFPSAPEYADELAGTFNNFGAFLRSAGKPAECLAFYEKARELQEKLVQQNPAVSEYADDLATTLNNIGNLQTARRQYAEAMASYQRALKIREKLVQDYPAVSEYAENLAWTYNSLGILQRRTRQFSEARESFQKSATTRERLVAEHPKVPDYSSDLAGTYINTGNLLSDSGQPDEAMGWYAKGRDVFDGLVRLYPGVTEYVANLGAAHLNLAEQILESAQPERALEEFTKTIETLRAVLQKERRNAAAEENLGMAFVGRAMALESLDRHAEALDAWDRALELADENQKRLRQWSRLGTLVFLGRHVEGTDQAKALLAESPNKPSILYNAACIFARATGAAHKDEQLEPAEREKLAESYAADAIKLLRQSIAAGFDDFDHMQKDPDLEPLRHLSEFKELIPKVKP